MIMISSWNMIVGHSWIFFYCIYKIKFKVPTLQDKNLSYEFPLAFILSESNEARNLWLNFKG